MIKKDYWLSNYFENGAYSINDLSCLSQVEKGFFFAKLPPTDKGKINNFLAHGFKFVEISILFEQKEFSLVKKVSNSFDVCFSKQSDKDEVVSLANNCFITSRFYQDRQIPLSTANQIKMDWVANFFSGDRGSHLIVAKKNDIIAGFLLLNAEHIDLIGVSPKYFNQGIASRMLEFANTNVGLLKAGTQMINAASIALYQKNGFNMKKGHVVLHYHVV